MDINFNNLAKNINLVSLIEKDYKLKKVGKDYRVNPCPICNGNDHFHIYTDTNSYFSFNGCCKGGTAYDYLMEVKGLSEKETQEEILKLNGYEDKRKKKGFTVNPKPTKAKDQVKPNNNLIKDIISIFNSNSKEDRIYFYNRGITDDLIDKYKLCIGNIFNDGLRAIIPIWKNGEIVSFNSRALEQQKPKYRKPKGQSVLFNSDYIYKEIDEPIFIVEGEFDSLSLETLGYKAIAIGGVNMANTLKSEIKSSNNDNIYISLTDNDKPGELAREELKFINVYVDNNYIDMNEWLIKDNIDNIKLNIENQLIYAAKPDNTYTYLTESLSKEIDLYSGYKDRITGFSNLDKITRMYPGLYVLGGLPTLGKTTFAHQLGDQMAKLGEHVLFFSLEMSTLEIATKSLSRLTVSKEDGSIDLQNGISALEIRLKQYSKEQSINVIDSIDRYSETSKNFNIIEGNFDTDILTIRKYIQNYIKLNKIKPLVIVDYLQIIPGTEADKSDKERVDRVSEELKRISRDFNISVIAISSLSRGNYLTPISFESFKESGGIEYTADVVWGLQLSAIHDDIFNSNQDIKKKRETMERAKRENPRKIELVCLKNRNGISSYTCHFKYFPKYDLFIPIEEKRPRMKELRTQERI